MPLLITRTTVPYISTTDMGENGREYGFGDSYASIGGQHTHCERANDRLGGLARVSHRRKQ